MVRYLLLVSIIWSGIGIAVGDVGAAPSLDPKGLERPNGALETMEAGLLLLRFAKGPSEKRRALDLLRAAAEGDLAEAQHHLGIAMMTSVNAEERAVGLYWLGAAASGGHALSAVLMGHLYENGEAGVERDLCVAFDFYVVGAEMGLHPPEGHVEKMLSRRDEPC